jgi:hypothetical protein
LAFFADDSRGSQVFRLGAPNVLPGVGRAYDQRREALLFTNRLHLAGPAGDRYFGELEEHPEWRATAELPIGDWATSDGVDIAVLYLPISDPGVASLRPRQNLGIENPETELRDALLGRTGFMGDTFQFDLVSRECMSAMQQEVRGLERGIAQRDQFISFFAGIAALALLGPALPTLLSPEVLSAITARAGAIVRAEFSQVVWRTLTRVLRGESLTSALWNEGNSLVMSFARDRGVQQIVLAGITGDGLTPDQRDAVLDTVARFTDASAPADTTLTVMSRDGTANQQCNGTRACVGSIESSDQGFDVAAELLLRGLTRLDVADEAVLQQQPTLVEAARDAIANPATRSQPAIADVGYQQTVQALAARILR